MTEQYPGSDGLADSPAITSLPTTSSIGFSVRHTYEAAYWLALGY